MAALKDREHQVVLEMLTADARRSPVIIDALRDPANQPVYWYADMGAGDCWDCFGRVGFREGSISTQGSNGNVSEVS